MAKTKLERRKRIKFGIRKKVAGTQQKPRLSVYKSNTAIYAQLIDDDAAKTLLSASSKEVKADAKSVNIELSKQVGKLIAERAVSQGISSIVFDRNGFLYHGNIKSLAEGAREGGLKF